MAQKLTILHVPGCPNAAVLEARLADALVRTATPAAQVTVEEIADPEEATRRGFHGSPALLVDGVDAFAGPDAPAGFACRTYRTEMGLESAPSVAQIVAALATGQGD